MITFRELTEKYLAFVQIHRAKGTYGYHKNYISQYLAFLGDKAEMPANEMKPYNINEWVDTPKKKKWGDNYKRGAAVSINCVYNWAQKEGRIEHNPIKTAHKPPAVSRKTYAKQGDIDTYLAVIHPSDPFREFIIFAWACGCRPQELRHIEPRHVDLAGLRIMFPASESKGKREPRRILINKTTLPIIERLMALRTEGKLFRNKRGDPWTKYAVCERMYRLSKKTGVKLTAYDFRHGYITKKIKDGVNHMVIAPAVGHKDGSMIGKTYSHVSQEEDHLRAALGD